MLFYRSCNADLAGQLHIYLQCAVRHSRFCLEAQLRSFADIKVPTFPSATASVAVLFRWTRTAAFVYSFPNPARGRVAQWKYPFDNNQSLFVNPFSVILCNGKVPNCSRDPFLYRSFDAPHVNFLNSTVSSTN